MKKIIFSLLLFFSPNLHAEISTFEVGGIQLGIPGEYRIALDKLGFMEFDLIDTPTKDRLDEQEFIENRFRFKPFIMKLFQEGAIKKIAIESEIEFYNNVLWATDIERDMLIYSNDVRLDSGSSSAKDIKVNKLSLTFSVPPFIVKAGRQKSHWGLGMLANEGEDKEEGEITFGYRKFGDIVDRAFLYILPLGFFPSVENKKALIVSIGGDRIVKDALAAVENDDKAYQIVSTATLNIEHLNAGIYYIYRWQENFLKDKTKVHVVDGYAKYDGKFGPAGVKLEGEFALVMGKTELLRNTTYPEDSIIVSIGSLGRIGFSYDKLTSLFEFGYASGDKNPFDDNFNTFSFNPDYRVGMLMFHEYLKTVTAVNAFNMANNLYSYEPPRGYKEIPSDGAVQNAFYFNPKLSLKPNKDIEFLAGLVIARSTVKLVDPFRTALAGGKETSPLGGIASDSLGFEVDFSAKFSHDFDILKALLAFECGHYQPGEAFTYSDGEQAKPVSMVQGRLHIMW